MAAERIFDSSDPVSEHSEAQKLPPRWSVAELVGNTHASSDERDIVSTGGLSHPHSEFDLVQDLHGLPDRKSFPIHGKLHVIREPV